jgi:hypothetical protein
MCFVRWCSACDRFRPFGTVYPPGPWGGGGARSDVCCVLVVLQWNEIAAAPHLVSLEHLNALVSVDVHKRQITAQAGMRLSTLQRILTDHGLSLPNLPSVDEQTIAGVVATATHGTGLQSENLSNRGTARRLRYGRPTSAELCVVWCGVVWVWCSGEYGVGGRHRRRA